MITVYLQGMIPILNKILNIIYPEKCSFCRKVLTHEIKFNSYVCKTCFNELSFVDPSIIKLSTRVKKFNANPLNGSYIDECISSFFHNGLIAKSIWSFKFRNKTSLVKMFSYYMYVSISQTYTNINFDLITYIPMYKKREQQRGYNQAQLLASHLSKLLDVPLVSALTKIVNTAIQHNLSANLRETNVIGVYKIKNKKIIDGKKILLIDDIITTGHTLNEASKILKKNGAAKVYCATIATPLTFFFYKRN